jgi:subtilisin family serine protease
MDSSNHNHQHTPNRFGVIPTAVRLNASPEYTGKGVTVAFLDSGFYPHPDLITPVNRVVAYEDLTKERRSLFSTMPVESWQWHGTQTSVAAAGNGQLSNGVYRGLAHEAALVLVKVSERGRITEENIAEGIKWIIANRERYNIRVLNISLGGDDDVPCSKSIVDQAAEEAISQGIAVIAAAGNSGAEGRHSIPPANSPSVITVGARTEHHALNLVGCKPPRVENGRLMFVFHDDSAHSVSVAGDFNGWSQAATPLKRNESGLWFTEIVVPRAGRFEYKFIINGRRWIEDPSNGMKTPNNYGGLNSVLVIE